MKSFRRQPQPRVSYISSIAPEVQRNNRLHVPPPLCVEHSVSVMVRVMSEPIPELALGAAAEAAERQNRFIAENMRRVFLIIYRKVGNVADAQDLTQEAFIKALQREDQLKDLEKAAHWLSRIATNTAIDFLRRHGRISTVDIVDVPERELHQPSESPEQRVLRAEHQSYMEDGLRLLTDRERMALIMRDVDGLPAEEVARELNCSKATVRSHIANARIKFRKYLERRKQ